MAATCNVILTQTDPDGKKVQKNIPNINPAVTGNVLTEFTTALTGLSQNDYVSTDRIYKSNCDSVDWQEGDGYNTTRTTPTVTVSANTFSKSSLVSGETLEANVTVTAGAGDPFVYAGGEVYNAGAGAILFGFNKISAGNFKLYIKARDTAALAAASGSVTFFVRVAQNAEFTAANSGLLTIQ